MKEASYYQNPSAFNAAPINGDYTNQDILSLPPIEQEQYYKFLVANNMKNCYCNPDDKDCHSGSVALAPDSHQIIDNIEAKIKALGINVIRFASNDAIDTYVQDDDYKTKPNICFGVSFTSLGEADNKYEYSLRYNVSGGINEVYSPDFQRVKKNDIQDLDDYYDFIRSGYLTIQNYIDNSILESLNSNQKISLKVASMKVKEYKKDQLPKNLMQGNLNTFVILPTLVILMNFVSKMLYDKEKKIKEGMKMMGMKSSSYYVSWIITYTIIVFIIALVQSLLQWGIVFRYSNVSLIFLLYFVFGLTLIANGIFLQVFFSKVKVGMMLALVYFSVSDFMLTWAIDTDKTIYPKSNKYGLAFFPQVALMEALENALSLEVGNKGLHFSNLTQEISGFKTIYAFVFMILNIAIFLILGLYLDQVFPNEFGVRKHPLFFLGYKRKPSKLYNTSGIKYQNTEVVENLTQTEQQQINDSKAIMIKNIQKTFDDGKKAVNKLSFNMFENQISVLLGHNGAGKTTLISMLSGLIEITSGEAQVYGQDVENDIDEIRQFLGVCPQHDILYEELTIEEHLRLYGTFKGIAGQELNDSVNSLIADLSLEEKRKSKSKTLSGGQKRRLSVAIAFIGNSKFVILDEPTSGMDTSARRDVWDILRNYKQNKIILLTTHFMDEADYLGDRITIMSSGKLKASGSSLFLKNKFGVGYNLVVVKQNQQKDNQITNVIKKHIKSAIVLSDVSSEITFQLPMNEMQNFEGLFNEIDQNKDKLQIQTYGISITTLEEVFLKVAEMELNQEKANEQKNLKEILSRKLTQSRNFKKSQENYNVQTEEQEKLYQEQQMPEQKINFITKSSTLFCEHLKALFIKRFHIIKRDKRGLVCELLLPVLMVLFTMSLISKRWFTNIDPLTITASDYDNPLDMYVGYQNQQDETAFTNTFSYFNSNDYKNVKSYVTDMDNFNNIVFDKKSSSLLGSYYIENTQNNQINYFLLSNTIAPESGILFINAMNQAIISNAVGSQISIKIQNYPLKMTKRIESFNDEANSMVSALYFSLGFAFISASLVVFLVKERLTMAKQQQKISGMSYSSYWLSNIVIDLVKYFIPAILTVLIVLAFNNKTFTNGKVFPAFIVLIVLYGCSLIPFIYVLSFIFKNHGTAQGVSFFICFFFGGIISMVVFILWIIDSTRSMSRVITWFFVMFPPYSFSLGLLNITNKEIFNYVDSDNIDKSIWSYAIGGKQMLILSISSIFYLILVFIIEIFKTNHKLQQSLNFKAKGQNYVDHPKDSDVLYEESQVENSSNDQYSVKVNGVRKIYENGFCAVQKISFGIENGDCFSLLGINGAGKTTTFKMLSGEFAPTEGQIFINGFNMKTQLRQIQKIIGYCPQFDALLDMLTCREHLELFAALKGIPKDERESIIEQILDEMQLKKFEHVCSQKLSGGNKRKLSVGIAIIGNPPVIFLDEPSTGMDPAARRFMWNVISRISTLRKQSTIILTTHSMEEAEALSTKLGIMVEGEFKCLGSIQHIKSKFGEGYQIEIKLTQNDENQILELGKYVNQDPNDLITDRTLLSQIFHKLGKPYFIDKICEKGSGSALYKQLNDGNLKLSHALDFFLTEQKGEQLCTFLTQNCGQYEIIENYSSYYCFRLNQNISVGNLFGMFEQNKQHLNIGQYSIKQATLEQIFNQFAQNLIVPDTNNQFQSKVQNNEQYYPQSQEQLLAPNDQLIHQNY